MMCLKKKEDTLIIDPFIPSNMNFPTILMPKVNLAKNLSEKAGPSEPFLTLVCSRPPSTFQGACTGFTVLKLPHFRAYLCKTASFGIFR